MTPASRLNSLLVCCITVCVSCTFNNNPKAGKDDSLHSGTIIVSVDETLKPLMEAEATVFQYLYPDAHLRMQYLPEREVLESFRSDSGRVAIITRELTKEEVDYFLTIRFNPRSIPFAKDGISLIAGSSFAKDSMTVAELKKLLTAGDEKNNTSVVFDNTGSSTVRWLKDSLLKSESMGKHCFACDGNLKVIDYVKTHGNAIGIIGNSWLSDRDDSTVQNNLKSVKRIRLALADTSEYVEPFQSEIETGRYPLSRMVYCIQRDGKIGLGTGFQRFLYDEKGQLVVLKSGMMPYRNPERTIEFKQD